MTTPHNLGDVLAGVRHLLLDFDGPICSIFGGLAAPSVADHLRGILTRRGITTPAEVTDSRDPFDILRFTAGIELELAEAIEAELRQMERRATRSAIPTLHADQVINACRHSGRTVSVVSNNSRAAVGDYLAQHDLASRFDCVIGRSEPDPALLKPDPHLVKQAIVQLDAEPAECVLVGDSVSDIQAAHRAGIMSIGYANKPGKAQRLSDAGAGTVITAMADLATQLNDQHAPHHRP